MGLIGNRSLTLAAQNEAFLTAWPAKPPEFAVDPRFSHVEHSQKIFLDSGPARDAGSVWSYALAGSVCSTWRLGAGVLLDGGFASLSEYLWVFALIAPAAVMCVDFLGGYRPIRQQRPARILMAGTLGPAAGMALLSTTFSDSRHRATAGFSWSPLRARVPRSCVSSAFSAAPGMSPWHGKGCIPNRSRSWGIERQ